MKLNSFRCLLSLFLLTLSLFGISSVSNAQQMGRTTVQVVMYAGPGGNFPIVNQIPAGASVNVYGCTSDFVWCDTTINQWRGWVQGQYVYYPYQGAQAPISQNGALMGLAVVTFAAAAYWGAHYRDRPWYNRYGSYNGWNYRSPPHYHRPPPPHYGHRPPPPRAPERTPVSSRPPERAPMARPTPPPAQRAPTSRPPQLNSVPSTGIQR